MQTSNKHIFIVTYDYPPSNGGIARLCFELKKYLEKKGLNVTVICPQSTSTDAEEDNNVVRLHGRRGILELRTLKYLRKKTVPGDIVITGNYHPEGMLSLLSNRETYILAHGAEYLAGKSFFPLSRELPLPHSERISFSFQPAVFPVQELQPSFAYVPLYSSPLSMLCGILALSGYRKSNTVFFW